MNAFRSCSKLNSNVGSKQNDDLSTVGWPSAPVHCVLAYPKNSRRAKHGFTPSCWGVESLIEAGKLATLVDNVAQREISQPAILDRGDITV